MKQMAIVIGGMIGLMGIFGFANALNPLDKNDWDMDPDNDGLNNREEFAAGTDPNNWDTDADGLPDGWEVENGLDPRDPSDADEDNDYFGGEEYASYTQVDPPYTNYDEYYRFYGIHADTGEKLYRPTNPNNPDTDGDNILDPDDSWPWDHLPNDPTDPTEGDDNPIGPGIPIPNDDTDGDGILDWYEALIGTDPFNPDTDGDGLSDPMELRRGLDPNDWDSDNDMLVDLVEDGTGGSTDGHFQDTDNDGI